jgi:hypothetical protein
METFEINGKVYEAIQREATPNKKPINSKMMGIMAVYGMMAMNSIYGSKATKEQQIPNVGIIEEFALIEQKKSKLSKAHRDIVIWQFNKNFKEVIQL